MRGCPGGGVLPPGGRRSKLRLKKFAFFDLRFGFLVKNCVYSHLGPEEIQTLSENWRFLIKYIWCTTTGAT